MANTSIGTAWIQIKPTTKGLRQAIDKELNADTTSAGQNAGTNFGEGFAAKVGVISGITQKVVGKAADIVAQSFDAAVNRADTLSNFTNIMGNLGIAEEDASNAVNRLQNSLDGLPTSLSDGVAAVQRFTTATGDVNQATDAFLAINDALLAGGASAETQSAALEQISQAYAKGKPDMMEWRSILTAMPAQLKQVADAMEFDSVTELGNALRLGELSMDDFMAKIIELDKTGVDGMRSFSEQAVAASDTIQQRLANLKNSVTRVVSDALMGNDMSSSITKLGERLVELIQKLAPGIANALVGVLSIIPQIIPPLLETLLGMAPSLFEGITQLIIGLAQMLPQLIPIITNALPTILTSIINSLLAPETLSALLQAGVELWMQLWLALPDVIIAIINALPDLINNIVEYLTNPDNLFKILTAGVTVFMALVAAVPQIVGALLGAFSDLFVKLWETLTKNFGEFAANFGEFLGGVFKTALNGVLSFIENFINMPVRLINNFIKLINKAFGAIGVNIGLIGEVRLPRLAKGGIVTGIGTDTSDSNLYALSKGEYVIKAASARQIGYDNLDRMNRTGEVSGRTEVVNNITINGYDKDPNELANLISRKIALRTQGVF